MYSSNNDLYLDRDEFGILRKRLLLATGLVLPRMDTTPRNVDDSCVFVGYTREDTRVRWLSYTFHAHLMIFGRILSGFLRVGRVRVNNVLDGHSLWFVVNGKSNSDSLCEYTLLYFYMVKIKSYKLLKHMSLQWLTTRFQWLLTSKNNTIAWPYFHIYP